MRRCMPILFATALAFGSMGCTSTCESVCEKGKACSEDVHIKSADGLAPLNVQEFDCPSKCDASEKKADDLGCESIVPMTALMGISHLDGWGL